MKPKSLVIVGCGTMGCDVAAVFLSQGWRVQAVTQRTAKWDARKKRIAQSVHQLGSFYQPGRMRFITSVQDVIWNDVAFGLESVPEIFDLKRLVFAELDRLAPLNIPLMTNTSGFRISEIAHDCVTRERMGGLHFFMPAHLVPAVEVVRGEYTEVWVVERLKAIMRSVNRIPIMVAKDVPGFLANRIQHALMREAFAVIEAGLATPEDVDAAV